VREHFAGAEVHYPPAAFGQANLDLFERIVTAIHARILQGVPVVELYAGVGAIGLGLAARGEQVVFNELGAGSLQGLHLGLAGLSSEARARVRVEPGAAEDVVSLLPLAGAQVIVDPPRKGLHPRVIEALLAARPRRLLYLSCGFESFLRDADSLLAAGLRCVELQPYALFPFTEHVEILAVFENSPSA
jgi:tRNA/tmRNA/rRNA uracil-C5-methylase (TrmA/RlmC/RlmD family)